MQHIEDLVRVFYPDGVQERYTPGIERAAMLFAAMLFKPDELGRAAGVNFKEYLPGTRHAKLQLDGLEALKTYRRQFGNPALVKINMFAVPRSHALHRLDWPDKRYDWDALMELNMVLTGDALSPAWLNYQGITPDAEVPVQLRMREALVIHHVGVTDSVEPQWGRDRAVPLVFGRTYRPYLVDRLGQPGDQLSHVAEQVMHWGIHGVPMFTTERWVPTYVAYNRTTPYRFSRNPLEA